MDKNFDSPEGQTMSVFSLIDKIEKRMDLLEKKFDKADKLLAEVFTNLNEAIKEQK